MIKNIFEYDNYERLILLATILYIYGWFKLFIYFS